MKGIRRFLKNYFSSWWLPLAVSLCNLTAFMVLFFPLVGTSADISFGFLVVLVVLLIGLFVSFFSLLCSALWSLLRQRWIKLISDTLMIFLFLSAVYLSISLLGAAAMDVGEENFSHRATTYIFVMMSVPQLLP